MEQKEVRKVADLARLTLTDEELATYGQQLTRILDYVKVLDEVDLEGVEPMPHAVELRNVFRQDAVHKSLTLDEALSNAPKTDGQFFQVPKILEQKQ